MKNKYIERRLQKINNRLLNLTFQLSFNHNLSKDQQSKLKDIENDLNDCHFRKAL